MLFVCPSCGYENKINDKCECEACSKHLDEMDDFINIENFLQELASKDKISLTPRLIHIYFSDYTSPTYEVIKQKFHLEDLIHDLEIDFTLSIQDWISQGKNKELANCLLKYDKKMTKYMEVFKDYKIFNLLEYKSNYWTLENFQNILKFFCLEVAKNMNIKDYSVHINSPFNQNNPNEIIRGQSWYEMINLNENVIKDAFLNKENIFSVIHTIVHEFLHNKIHHELVSQNIDQNIYNLMECCIEKCCRYLP